MRRTASTVRPIGRASSGRFIPIADAQANPDTSRIEMIPISWHALRARRRYAPDSGRGERPPVVIQIR